VAGLLTDRAMVSGELHWHHRLDVVLVAMLPRHGGRPVERLS
jgi:hypothetical protein